MIKTGKIWKFRPTWGKGKNKKLITERDNVITLVDDISFTSLWKTPQREAELTGPVLGEQMGLEEQEAKHHIKACRIKREVSATFPDQTGMFTEHPMKGVPCWFSGPEQTTL